MSLDPCGQKKLCQHRDGPLGKDRVVLISFIEKIRGNRDEIFFVGFANKRIIPVANAVRIKDIDIAERCPIPCCRRI